MKSPRWALFALLLAAAALPAQSQTTKPRPAGTTAPGSRQTPPRRTSGTPSRATRTTAPPVTRRLDGIAAVVNDDVILQSDVEEQLYLYVMQNQLNPDSAMVDTLRRQILDQMINDRVIVAEAKRQGLSASEPEVNREVDRAIVEARERMGPDGFREQLARENLTEEQLRARYREQATRLQLRQKLQGKAVPQKPVTTAEAEAFFKANPDKFPRAPAQVRVSLIQIPITPDSAADAAGRAKALEVRRRIVTGGEKFAKVAAEVSDDPGSAKSGGDLGFFAKGSMEGSLEEGAFTLPLNQVSDPVRSPFGWHLLQVLERDTLKTAAGRDSLDADGKPIAEAHARHILVRVETNDTDRERAHRLAQRVHDEAVKGMDFGALVRRYSKYVGPATPDGDIGFLALSTLDRQPQIRAGIDSLETGQISEPLENQAGFNLFKLTDRKPERPYTFEEVKEQLPDFVGQIRWQERFQEWVKSLRAKAHIEIRGV